MSKCSVCDQEAVLKCGNCGGLLYCSEEHKKTHASSHKKGCRPYVVEKNDKYGRYLVASRDIKQGEIILKENPITIGPRVDSLPACLECFAPLYPPVLRCSRCKFIPLCAKCVHNSVECDFYSKLTPEQTKRCLQAGVQFILPLKVMLCSRLEGEEGEKYKRLLGMEAHTEARRDTGVWKSHQDNVVELLQACNVISKSTADEEEVQKICGILDVNSFELRGAGGVGLRLRGVFVEAALIAHDCVTNVHLAVDDNFTMFIRASLDIPEGHPILYNYTDPLQPTSERQDHLQNGKYFSCSCSRCSDPTELGTYMSAILCPRCRVGRTVPSTVPDTDHWNCNTCKHQPTLSLIYSTELAARDVLETVDRTSLPELEAALVQLSRSLAPTHSLLLDLKQSIVALLRELEPTEERVRRKIQLCKEILPTLRILEPGISRLIGITLYELHIGLVTLGQDLKDTELLTEAEEVLKEAVNMLLYEPTHSPEGSLARQAMQELKTLKQMIAKMQLSDKKKNKSRQKS